MDGLAQLFGPSSGGAAPQGDQPPDFSAPPPASPEELTQRTGVWKQLLTRLDTDPNLRQAVLVTGLKLMQPGANIGSAGLAGVATYNAGEQAQLDQQAQQTKASLAQAAEGRAQATHDLNMQQGQLNVQKAEQSLPFDLKQLQADAKLTEAKIAAVPQEAERRKLQLDLERLKLEQEPKMAQLRLQELQSRIAAASESRQATADARTTAAEKSKKGTDQERAIGALMANPEWKDLPDEQKYMMATQEFYGLSRGQSGRAKASEYDTKAVDLYTMIQQDPEGSLAQMTMIDPEQAAMYQRGARLYAEQAQKKQGTPSSSPAPSQRSAGQIGGPTTTSPQRRLITSDELRKSLSQ